MSVFKTPDELEAFAENETLEPAQRRAVGPLRMTLKLTMFADIDPHPHKVWLVARLLGDGELSCIFGAPGRAKSALAEDLALHIAVGRPWLGRHVTQGAVLYVAAERVALVKRRAAAWRKFYSIDDLPLAVLDGTIDLRSSTATADEIAEHAHRLREATGEPLRLIAIDTVSRALNGGDENSPKDTRATMSRKSSLPQPAKSVS